MFNLNDIKKKFHRGQDEEDVEQQENSDTLQSAPNTEDEDSVKDIEDTADGQENANNSVDDDLDNLDRPKTLGDVIPDMDSQMTAGDLSNDLSELTTVKKKRILAIIVCTAAFGVGAIMATSMFSSSTPKGDPSDVSGIQPSSVNRANPVGTGKNVPSDYAAISQYQHQKTEAVNNQNKKGANQVAVNQNGQNGTNGVNDLPTPVDSSSVDYLAPRPLPPINSGNTDVATNNNGNNGGSYADNSGYGGYSESPEELEAREARKERMKADQRAYTSAISFVSDGGSSTSRSSGGSAEKVTLKPGSNGGTAFFGSDPADSGSGYTLQSGSVVQATLLTGINSDMGNTTVMAQVSQNVYDTDTGEHLLIPQGSKLIGKAGSVGGNRVGVTFERLIFPDGTDVALPNMGVIDGTGIPGMKDQYNSHDSTFFRGALISGLLGYLSDKIDDNSGSSTSNSGWGSSTTYNDNLSNVVDNITDRLMERVDRQSSRSATVTIRPGFQFSIFINADLQIPEYGGYSPDGEDYDDSFLT